VTSNFVYLNNGTAQYFQNGAILNSPQFGLKLVNGSLGNYYVKNLGESTRYWLGVAYTAAIDLGGGNLRQFFTGGTIDWKANGTGDVRFTSYSIGSTSIAINTAFVSKFNEADGWNTLGNPNSYVRSITGGNIQDFANGSIIQTGAGVFVLDNYINSAYNQEKIALGLPIGNKIATTNGFKQDFEKGIIFINSSNQTFVLKDAFAVSYRGLTAAQSQELGVLTSNITNINGGTTQLFQNGAFISSAQFGFQVSKGNLGGYYSKGLSDSTRYWIGVPYTTAIDLGGGNSRQFFTSGTIEWKANGTGEVRFISYPIGLTGSSVNNAFISKFNEVDGWTTLGNPTNTVQSITGGSIQDFSSGSIIQTGSGVFVLDAYINSAYKQEQAALGLPIGNKTAIAGGFKQEFEKGIVFSNSYNQTFVLKDAFAVSYRGLSNTQAQELGALTSNIANINGGTTQFFQNGAFINSAQFGFQVSKGSLGKYYTNGLSDSTRYWLGVPYTAAIDLGGGNLRQFFTSGTIDWKANGTGEVRFISYPIGSTGSSINNAFISKFNEIDAWNVLGSPSSYVRSITGGNIQDFSSGSIIQTGTGVFVLDNYINSAYKQEQAALGLPIGNKIATTNGFKQEFEKGFIFVNPYNQTFVLKDTFAVSYRGLTTAQSQELGVLTSNVANINGGTTQLFQNGAFVNSAQFGFQVLKGSLGSYYSNGLSDSTRYWVGVPYTAAIDLGGGNLRQFFTGGTIEQKANGTGEVRFTSYPIGSTGTSINNAFISKFNEVDGWNILGYPSSNVRSITGGNIQDFSNGSIIQTNVGVFIVDSYINSTYKQEQTALGLPIGNKVSTTNGFKQEFEKGFIFINPYNQTFVLKDTFAVSYRGLTAAQSQELGVLTSNIGNINGGTTQLFQNGAFINSAQFGFQVLKGNLGKYYTNGLSDSTRYWVGVPYTAEIDLGSGNLRQFFTGGTIDWKANGTGEVRYTSYPIGSTGTSINTAFISKFNEIDGWNSLGYPSSNVRSITGGNIQDFSNGSIIQTNVGVFIVDSYINSTYKQEQTALGLPIGNKVSTTNSFKQEFEKGFIFVNPYNQTFVLKDTFAVSYRGLTAAQSQELGVLTSNVGNINGGTAQIFQNGAIVNSVQNGFQLLNGNLGRYYSQGLSDSSRYWLGTPYTAGLSLGSGNLRQFFTGGTIDWKANGTGEIRYTSYPIGSTGTSINTAFISKFNEVDGWTTLGSPSSNVRSIIGGSIQDFNYGTIIQTNAGVFTLDTATTGWYRQDPSALGLPIGHKVSIVGGFKQEFEKGIIFTNPSNQTFILKDSFASYYRGLSSAQVQELGALTSNFSYVNNGTAQYFQNGALLNSTQFGLKLVNGSVGNYYIKELAESTRSALGVPYTAAMSLTGGGLRQFFTGGTIDWKANGTGEVRFSSYPIGSTGSSINPDYIAKFNEVDGWTTLGNPTSAISALTGGSIQLFSNGSIVQTNSGVYVLDTYTTSLYRQEQSALGLPTGNRVATSSGFRQDFEKGIIFSTSNQAFVLKDTFASYYRGLSTAQMQELGVLNSNFSYVNGGTAQYFQNGAIYQTQAGTFSVRGTEFNQLYTQNVGSLGLLIGDVVSTTYGTRQDFQNGSIFKSSAGTFVVDGLISGMYRFKFSSFGAPIGNKVATANGFRQDFQNGILISNVATSQTFSLTGAIATYYKGLSAAQLQELGVLVADARESSGTLIQDFQSGSIYKTSTGTFRTSGEIGKYDFDRNMPGVPLGEAVTTSYGSRQDFSEGTVMYSVKTGIRLIEGNLGKYYQSLTEAQKNQLGYTYYEQVYHETSSSFRFFQGGVLEVKSNGSNQVRFTAGAIGFDGTNFNDQFIRKFMSIDAFDGLGDPTSNIYNANGILRQDFQKGYITQNGSTMEALFYPPNLGVLGSNKLTANGRATYSLPTAYTFMVNQQTYSSITLSSSNSGVPGLTLLNSQNQVVASDAQGRSIQSNLAPGTYTVKVTSTSVSDFTLDVQVSTAPPTVTGGGVIFIGSGSNNNTQPSNNGTISNNGSVITINWNGNNGNTNTSSNTSIQIKGSVGDYYYNRIGSDARQRLGSAQANEVSLGTDIWKQDFQGGTIFHGPKGSYLLVGTLHHNYYNVLSASDRQRLGMPISNETPDGGYWHQSFENGVLQLVSNAPVAWNNNSQNQTQPQSSYINENAYGRTDTQWAAKVFSWDSSKGKPPADFFNGNTIAELDLGSNDLGNGRKGLKFDAGTGSLRNGLPGDAFAVRAYTQASFDGGQYKFAVRGDDGFQIFAKNIDTNEWIYITPKDEWQQAYGSHQEITYDLPQGRYDFHFHYFEGGGNAYFDLSWEKLGGISNSAGFNAANFRGSVKPTDGINIRNGPGTNFAIVGSTAGGTLSFDGWKVGTSHYDQEAGQYDDRWFRIQGTNTWVASAYIKGNPNQSVVAGTLPSDNTTLTTNQSPLFSSPTSQNPLTGFSSPLGGNLVVNQGNGGTFSHVDRMQYAVDYDAAIGTSVYAMRSGKVIEVSDIYPDTGGGASNINRFNYVLIEHDGGYRSAYLHLQQNFNNRVGLKIGDIVNGGQLIGYSGNSGWSTGPHLHVEVHKGYFGQTVPFVISGVSSSSPKITSPNTNTNTSSPFPTNNDDQEINDIIKNTGLNDTEKSSLKPILKHLLYLGDTTHTSEVSNLSLARDNSLSKDLITGFLNSIKSLVDIGTSLATNGGIVAAVSAFKLYVSKLSTLIGGSLTSSPTNVERALDARDVANWFYDNYHDSSQNIAVAFAKPGENSGGQIIEIKPQSETSNFVNYYTNGINTSIFGFGADLAAIQNTFDPHASVIGLYRFTDAKDTNQNEGISAGTEYYSSLPDNLTSSYKTNFYNSLKEKINTEGKKVIYIGHSAGNIFMSHLFRDIDSDHNYNRGLFGKDKSWEDLRNSVGVLSLADPFATPSNDASESFKLGNSSHWIKYGRSDDTVFTKQFYAIGDGGNHDLIGWYLPATSSEFTHQGKSYSNAVQAYQNLRKNMA
jgi:murein DD-endopeptidase MepM/ murein hydrolase activator NlpD/uncharacterized protein with LGFP repeats